MKKRITAMAIAAAIMLTTTGVYAEDVTENAQSPESGYVRI